MSADAPKNGIYIVLGEVNSLMIAMKRNVRYQHQFDVNQDPLMKSFIDLKNMLNMNSDLIDIDATTFLAPFLEVIKSEETNGPITGLALTAVDKFISYGLIDTNSETVSLCVQHISDAVTHARFVGTDATSDEVILMKILNVLHTLMMSPIGVNLTNSSVCEIMQSCFQICFETKLGELLRKSSELILIDMIQLLFARLPQFKDELKMSSIKKLTMRGGNYDSSRHKKNKKPKTHAPKIQQAQQQQSEPSSNSSQSTTNQTKEDEKSEKIEQTTSVVTEATSTSELQSLSVDTESIGTLKSDEDVLQSQTNENYVEFSNDIETATIDSGAYVNELLSNRSTEEQSPSETSNVQPESSANNQEPKTTDQSDYVNPRGVRFVQDASNSVTNIPYGLPCVRELLRFLISLIGSKNSDMMIHMGLSLIIVALESGVDHLASYTSLLVYVKDDLCKNLFNLLAHERLSIYSSALRACFMLFESLRSHLKLQLEHFFTKLMEIIVSEMPKISYDHKEIAIDHVVQMLRIPGLPVELYLNYDCSLSCSNLFEDLTKLLSKNAFPVQGLYPTNSLSLAALLTVIENIELENTINKAAPESSLSLKTFNRPAAPGYCVAQNIKSTLGESKAYRPRDSNRSSMRVNRMKVSANLPTHEELKKIRIKKKLISQGVELFNQSPSKGVQFLRENALIDANNLEQLVDFLKHTPTIDKKAIGEYISNRKNAQILETFVKSFSFENMRIDEALRSFLETFRLPGEAPLISSILEKFAEHWRNSNGKQLASVDAAFTLSYAVIMLNTDQHNHNVKKQSIPMSIDDFKKNLSKVNDGQNFDDELLEEIYSSIRNEEIIMPAEQKGEVKENYLWKVLIRRSINEDALFTHAPAGSYNYDIFNIIWGQTVAALSFVYDKSLDAAIIQKIISGFRKCAQVAAYYKMSDVFDNITISLCKFTTLLSHTDSNEQLPIYFGMNNKAQLACKTVFQLTHSHGDILRDGWKNILDCIIQLYRANLLPRSLLECEDFLHPSGHINLFKEETQVLPKQEGSGLFSFFPFMSQDSATLKGPTPEEQEAIKVAKLCVEECHIEQLIHDTKFLRVDSLLELIKALIFFSQSIEQHQDVDVKYDQDAAVFSLEIFIKVILQNRDRIKCIWLTVRNHFYNIISNSNEYSLFLERAVIGLIRISTRLLRREEITNEVLLALRMLLLVKPKVIQKINRHVSYGFHDLLRTNAANIHESDDWVTIFSILQVVGAGAPAPSVVAYPLSIKSDAGIAQSAKSETDLTSENKYQDESGSQLNLADTNKLERGYTSDSEIYSHYANHVCATDSSASGQQQRNDWILVNKEDIEYMKNQQNHINQYKIDLDETLHTHDRKAFLKCCETLAFLVRDVAHITPENFESCIHCLRTFVEACVNGYRFNHIKKTQQQQQNPVRSASRGQMKAPAKQSAKMVSSSSTSLNEGSQNSGMRSSNSVYGKLVESDEDDSQLMTSYETISIQLLDLLDTLHNKAASIFTAWSEEQKRCAQKLTVDATVSNLWMKCWCPILQGIARLSCDANGEVRMQALQYLQRALLVHDLQTLSAIEWEACFNKVLFPLLAKLLENIDPHNSIRLEETRMRASTLLCKVFLQHLTTLARLSTFTALWLTILDYMDKYMKSDKSDILHDVIPESLKNMLLVMETTGLFSQQTQDIKFSQLCMITKDRIESFLPGLWDELFKVTSPSISTVEVEKQVENVEAKPDAVFQVAADNEDLKSSSSSVHIPSTDSEQAAPAATPPVYSSTEDLSASQPSFMNKLASDVQDL